MTRPPVILIGMHRSGTTLVVRLLQQLGWFAGAYLDDNAEAWFFLRRNEWLLRRAGGSWDYPLPVATLLGDPGFREEVVTLFRCEVGSAAFREFVGRDGATPGAWGWKDPRNVFTLDVWREVYPRARVVYVRRHAIDVAHSLVVRHRRIRDAGDTVLTRWPLRSRLKAALSPLEFHNHFNLSARCTSLAGAFALWEDYAGAAEREFAACDGDKLVVDFESLLADPAATLAELAAFCGCEVDGAAVSTAVATIDRGKARAFAGDPELVAFHRSVRERPLMRELGYDAPVEAT